MLSSFWTKNQARVQYPQNVLNIDCSSRQKSLQQSGTKRGPRPGLKNFKLELLVFFQNIFFSAPELLKTNPAFGVPMVDHAKRRLFERHKTGAAGARPAPKALAFWRRRRQICAEGAKMAPQAPK